MTAILIALVVILYVSGACLMRAFLKVGDCDDQDSWIPVVAWPYYIITPIAELLIKEPKNFKW